MDERAGQPTRHCLPGFDDVEQRCWQQFVDTSLSVLATVNAQLLGRHKLGLIDLLLLDVLNTSNRGFARISELADALTLAPTRVGTEIRRLEAHGFITHTRSPGDRRGMRPRITWEGQAVLEDALKTYAQEVRTNCLDQLSREQMIALDDSCRQISGSVKSSGRLARFNRI